MNDQTAKDIAPHCTICHQEFDLYYRTPRVVPKCGHTFCEKCITFRLTVKLNRRVFMCPDCGGEAVIRKSVADDIPKNVGIIEVVKSLKKYSWQEQKKSTIGQKCSEHGRQLQLICQTCKFKKICSHCALFGEHRNHSFVKQMPASKLDLSELKSSYDLVKDSIQRYLLPNGVQNIRVAMKASIIQGLKKTVNSCFKQFYAILQKKQFQLLQECDNIVINEGGIDTNMDSLIRQYDKIKDTYEIEFKTYSQFGINPQKGKIISVEQIEQFILKCDEIHGNLQTLMKHSSAHIDKITKDIGTHILQANIFKIQQMPFSIKRVVESLSTQENIASPSKRMRLKSANSQSKTKSVIIVEKQQSKNGQFHSFDRTNHSQHKTTAGITRKYRDTFSQAGKGEALNQNFSTLEPNAQSDLDFYKQQAQKELKELISNKAIPIKTSQRGNLPPKAEKSKFSAAQQSRTVAVRNVQKQEIKAKERSSIGKELSPAKSVRSTSKVNQSRIEQPTLTEDLKFIQPTKEISFHFLSKFQQIIVQIDRQSQSNTLELNSKDINDILLLYMLDYLRGKKYVFQVIKLVKNMITDQGMRILLSYLINDNTTQVLNLTSNQLTPKTLGYIILFSAKNNILRTLYLSNNKISPFQLKSRKADLEKYQVEIIV